MTTTVRVRVVPTAPVIRARVTPASQPLQAALRNTGTLIQWRIGQDGDWQDLIEIDDIDASVEVGTVTTLAPGSPATVTNVGTAQAAVLDFGIPAGASGSGAVASVAAGTGIDVDNTDPNNPVVALDAGTQASLALADSALQSSAIGVSVQAYNANLTEWATLNPSANAGSLVTAADYAAMRTLLGLVIGTNVQAYDADLTTWAGLTPSANAQSLVTAANYAAMRALLDLEAGTDFYSVSAANAAFATAAQGALAGSAIQSSLLTTRGDIIYRNATVPARLAKGTQYQVLQAGAADPAYGAVNLAQAAAVTGVLPAANLPDASTTAEGIVELATAAEYRTGTDTTRALNTAEAWDAADLAVLTDGTTIAVDFAAGFNFGGSSNAPLGLGGNRTLGAPSNVSKNQAGVLWFTAVTSTRTLTLNAAWELATGVEAGPYSITTAQELGIAYVVRGSDITVTAILRKAV